MGRLSELGFLFRAVAIVELVYGLAGLLSPLEVMGALPGTGWVMSADGLWATKLLSVALLSQAWIAWTLRDQPHLGVAKGLAFYQVSSATADWVMWIALSGEGIFSTTLSQVMICVAIPTHYLIGLLLMQGIRSESARSVARVPEGREAAQGA